MVLSGKTYPNLTEFGKFSRQFHSLTTGPGGRKGWGIQSESNGPLLPSGENGNESDDYTINTEIIQLALLDDFQHPGAGKQSG